MPHTTVYQKQIYESMHISMTSGHITNCSLTRRDAACALQEVIVVEDENGNIVRETMKDNDVLTQYKNMRETLVYLSNLDHDDTERQMLERLRAQMTGNWSWNGLNTLCWAIGSISGSMAVGVCTSTACCASTAARLVCPPIQMKCWCMACCGMPTSSACLHSCSQCPMLSAAVMAYMTLSDMVCFPLR